MSGTYEDYSAFVGRKAEYGRLTDMLERAKQGHSPSLLLGGEAGVGKTRLLQEFCQSADKNRVLVAVGECVGPGLSGEGLPWAAVAAALRSVRRRIPGDFAAALGSRPGDLAGILPECAGDVPSGAGVVDGAPPYEPVARLLENLAADRTVLLVLEDLHWADASTRNLVEYLARSHRIGRLMVVGTYRSDALHAGHPLLPFIGEMQRAPAVAHLVLKGLLREEVRRQVTGILAAVPPPALVDSIHRRTDGNPYFVEELTRSLGADPRAGLSESLRGLLLVRLRSLPEAAQRIADLVAEGGGEVDYRLLRAVAALPEDELLAALRSAVSGQVLWPTADRTGYRFRHALVGEAVRDEVLPGVRARLNQLYAEALEADPTLVRPDELSPRLSGYWHAAGDSARAFPHALQGVIQARQRHAYAEHLHMLERVLTLWDAVPPTARAALAEADTLEVRLLGVPHTDRGPRRIDVLAEAVVAARRSADRERALALADQALTAAEEPGDRLAAAWFWTQRSLLEQDLAQGDGRAGLSRAEELIQGLPPSAVHADVLVNIAGWGARHRPGPDTLDVAERAVRYADQVGAVTVALHARITRGWLKAATEDYEDGIAELFDVLDRARAHHAVDLLGRLAMIVPSALEGVGRSALAVAAAQEAARTCEDRGLDNVGAWVLCNQSLSLYSLGRWAESLSVLEQAAAVARSRKACGLVAVRRAQMALASGNLAEAGKQVQDAHSLFGTHDSQPQLLIHPSEVEMRLAAHEGRIDHARAIFRRVAAVGLSAGTERYTLPLLYSAVSIEADVHQARGANAEGRGLLAEVRAHAANLSAAAPIWHAHHLMLQAELNRAVGADTAEAWARAASALANLERPYELAIVHGRWAAALLARSGGASGARLIRQAHAAARSLGARLLTAELAATAARHGADLGPDGLQTPADDPASSALGASALRGMGLTPRECQVLRLLAVGRSNRQIGADLHISPKTASLHVSSILTKMNVATRTQAAAQVYRQGLFTDL